ncbi:unnamed protein product [Rotaria sp. Silwood1]|nr:unnamed protein product [Rotaria sp. Silwood1]CAF3399816.1 unnamed protein product [Rotaria sp. Silwood1]CAF3403068.1 unnamed protein product [Rotaria sp. Silwood1]CAF3403575.1 unnamed protein product [Rotaria sp. Silwood1]CAF4859357.1 unnamed protein product [Rotaria sp. Silwood1]
MLRFAILLICILAPLTISKSIKKPRCGGLCRIYCQYGNVLDKRGCPICQCNPSPCKNQQAPLPDYFCGRGLNRTDCPSNYTCVIAPNDSYAVCCPSNEQSGTKPGSCPPPPQLPGNCIAKCTTDIDCKGKLKCCGSCPRQCVKPLH